MKEENYSSNGWQNIGICTIFALEQIQYSKIPLYMYLVRNSFGYCKLTTSKISQSEMAKKLNIDKKTLASHMKYLVENEFVEIVCSTSYVDGGGSESYAYAPLFPRGYGELKWKPDDSKPKSESKLDAIRKKEEEQRNENYF